MSQYFIETETKQPQFFCFNRVLENQESGLDYAALLEEFQNNFDKQQEDNWIKFWNKQGEEIVLEKWNEKYKEYLQDIEKIDKQENIAEEAQKEQQESIKLGNKIKDLNPISDFENIVSAKNLNETNEDFSFETKSWQDLWHEHREEIYFEQFVIFSAVFYNYILDFKYSLEIQEVAPATEDINLSEDLQQLQLLGLPSSFGGKKQNCSKKRKTVTVTQINYSDFFSDSEMENDSSDTDKKDESKEIASPIGDNADDSLHSIQNKLIKKTRRRPNRKLKNVPPFILAEKGLLKYWHKRFSLFSRFDEGIRLDRESWFSVTPEKVARHLADRLKCSIIVDGFCGSGGNAIQFALTCEQVIAIDIDPVKLEMAKHNAEIYKVAHKIEFVLGDFLQLAASGKFKSDIVFLSPPWGGPKYKNKQDFDIEKHLLPVKASALVEVSRNISKNIALFLPRNSNVKQIVKLAGVGNRCEIEHNYLDSRLVAITALYGEHILKKMT